MELKTCEYCGTAYDARLRQCPLCGRTAAGPAAPAEPERTSPVPEKSAHSGERRERSSCMRAARFTPGRSVLFINQMMSRKKC